MPKITLSYHAMSNIRYNGSVSFDVDDEEWKDMDTQEREGFLSDKFDEWLREDIQSTAAFVDGVPFDE